MKPQVVINLLHVIMSNIGPYGDVRKPVQDNSLEEKPDLKCKFQIL
jgi:hypothetical protein